MMQVSIYREIMLDVFLQNAHYKRAIQNKYIG